MKPLPIEEIHRVLVVRTDHVGDLILSTPFLKALRKGVPEAEIIALVTGYTAAVLEGNPCIDRILTEEEDLRPDLAISLAPRSASYRLVHRTGARYRVGYVYSSRPITRLGAVFWLTHRLVFDIETRLARKEPVPHEVEQLGHLAQAMGLPYEDSELELPLNEGHRDQARALVQGRPIGFHLGSGWLTGEWELSAVRKLLSQLAELSPVVVTYGPGEAKLVTPLAESPPESVQVVGGVSLKVWAAVLERCSAVVSNDTGAVHVAAALKRPVVVAYEPGTHELCSQQWAPWKTPHRSLLKADPTLAIPALVAAVEDLLKDSRN